MIFATVIIFFVKITVMTLLRHISLIQNLLNQFFTSYEVFKHFNTYYYLSINLNILAKLNLFSITYSHTIMFYQLIIYEVFIKVY